MALTRFGSDAAGSWRDAASSPLARWVTLGIGIAGIIGGTAGSPEVTCTPLDPCTPLVVDAFGVLLGLLALSFVGLWLWPAAGGVLGLAAALIDVRYDPSTAGRVVFAAYAVACLHLLMGLRQSRRAQRAVLDDVPREPVVPGRVPVVASGREVWAPGLWLGAAAALVVAVLSFGAFAGEKASDADHRDRAVKTTGTVVSGWDDDLLQRVSIDQVGLPDHVRVSASGELPPSSRVVLLVDPRDPTWTEIPSDPLDHSHWLALGIIGLGLAFGSLALLGMRAWIATSRLTEGIAVEVSVSRAGQAFLRPVGGAEPVGSFLTGPPSPLGGGGGTRHTRSRVVWEPGVAVGDLRDRAWVKVYTDTGVITPGTPLRTIRADEGDTDLSLLPGVVPLSRTWNALKERVPLREAGLVVLGLVLTLSSSAILPDAIVVAEGGGVAGTLTITSESCSKSCSYSGDFRSHDGRYVFRDVFFHGTGTIGSTWPAVYVGSGEPPGEVYEPGNGALLESGFFGLVGIGVAGWPFVRRFLDRHAPPARHGAS